MALFNPYKAGLRLRKSLKGIFKLRDPKFKPFRDKKCEKF